LNKEKNKNKKFLEELNKGKIKVKELNNKIKTYENSNNEYKKKLKELEELIKSKNKEINNLKKKINNNEIKIIESGGKIIEQIEMLKFNLNDTIRRYKILNKEINNSKDKLNIEIKNKNELIDINELLIKEIKRFNDPININENKNISNLDKDKTIKELYKDIDELNKKLSLYPFELSKGEKLISLIFSSLDENILCSVICKNTEKFSELEEKLYNDYPEYSNFDNYFLINGNRVNKKKTLDENKIKNGDIIILIINNI